MRKDASNSRFQPISAAELQQVAGGASASGANACCTSTNFLTSFSNFVTAAAPLGAAIEQASGCNPCVVGAVNVINDVGAVAGLLAKL
jgi:hypothetical protein